MAENKISYNEGWLGRVGDEPGEGMGYLELWVGKEGLEIHETPTGEEVGNLNMNGRFAGPSGVKYALGEDILGEDGVMFVNVSFWKYQLDAIKKMDPKKGQRYRIAGKFIAETYNKKDGTVGHRVRVNAQKFQIVYTRKMEENTEATSETPVTNPEPIEEKTKKTTKTGAKKSKAKTETAELEYELPF